MTFTLATPAATIYTLLSTYWTAGNINGTITPTFGRMEQLSAKRGKYHILVYNRPSTYEDVGRGSHWDVTDLATIEIRAQDVTNDTIPRQLLQEVLRIINTYRITPGGGYDYIHVTGDRDESYQSNRFYRFLVDVELLQYGVSKT